VKLFLAEWFARLRIRPSLKIAAGLAVSFKLCPPRSNHCQDAPVGRINVSYRSLTSITRSKVYGVRSRPD